MKKLFFVFALMLITGFVMIAAQQPAWAKAQANCPVMGGAINKNVYADHNGKRVYFCCNACPEVFKKDPDKYIKKLESEGIELEKAPAVPAK